METRVGPPGHTPIHSGPSVFRRHRRGGLAPGVAPASAARLGEIRVDWDGTQAVVNRDKQQCFEGGNSRRWTLRRFTRGKISPAARSSCDNCADVARNQSFVSVYRHKQRRRASQSRRAAMQLRFTRTRVNATILSRRTMRKYYVRCIARIARMSREKRVASVIRDSLRDAKSVSTLRRATMSCSYLVIG